MAILQPLIDIAAICYAHGVRHVVISPGSRSAALTLAFTRHQGFEYHRVMDERSAGFLALGMAQQLRVPVVLVCTSGSAAYNYAPAVAEAFFQHIPLIVLTADRPKEWIHQLDGQTIYQTGIYGQNVKKSFEIPADYAHPDAVWLINRSVNEALIVAGTEPFGPVHINIPVREPFYPAAGEVFAVSDPLRIIRQEATESTLPSETWHQLLDAWEDSEKILIAGGQHENNESLNAALKLISEELEITVLGDCISNQTGSVSFITYQDLLLMPVDQEKLRPDLLITYGLSFISKEFKQFLRKYPARAHWHIGEGEHLVDTFQSLTKKIPVSPAYFFKNVFEKIDYQQFVQNSEDEFNSSYQSLWRRYEEQAGVLLDKYISNLTSLNDLTCIDTVILSLYIENQIHIANSMPIRYVNALGARKGSNIIFANRGTSGIDGCVSTAIGAARVNGRDTFLIVGDVAFLYDRNGLLINPLPGNLKIIVINNGGGNIFRMIDGPAALPELEDYFETRHSFTARLTAEDAKIPYYSVADISLLAETIDGWKNCQGIALLEVFTDPVENTRVWKDLKTFIRSNWQL